MVPAASAAEETVTLPELTVTAGVAANAGNVPVRLTDPIVFAPVGIEGMLLTPTDPSKFDPAGSGCDGSRPTVTTETSGADEMIAVTPSVPAVSALDRRTRNCGNPATAI